MKEYKTEHAGGEWAINSVINGNSGWKPINITPVYNPEPGKYEDKMTFIITFEGTIEK